MMQATPKLLSYSFSNAIEKAFNNATSRNVNEVTKAYYVYTDLKAGIELESIEKDRLIVFKNFLYKYLNRRIDDFASILLTKVDLILD